MDRKALKRAIQLDYESYRLRRVRWIERLLNPGFKLSTTLRKCQYYKEKVWGKPLWLLYRVHYHKMCVKYGFEVPSSVQFGPGLTINHPNGILINSRVTIGSHLVIHGGVKIGQKEQNQVPEIGNHVNIGVNACIIGAVKIGDGATIGAGAVVVKDVSPNTTVAGNPAKEIVSNRGINK